jgi:hypothetical protein
MCSLSFHHCFQPLQRILVAFRPGSTPSEPGMRPQRAHRTVRPGLRNCNPRRTSRGWGCLPGTAGNRSPLIPASTDSGDQVVKLSCTTVDVPLPVCESPTVCLLLTTTTRKLASARPHPRPKIHQHRATAGVSVKPHRQRTFNMKSTVVSAVTQQPLVACLKVAPGFCANCGDLLRSACRTEEHEAGIVDEIVCSPQP